MVEGQGVAGMMVMCLGAAMMLAACDERQTGPRENGRLPAKIPIIFSPRYDIGLFGIEKLHPFDSRKYGKAHRYLVEKAGVSPEGFYAPERVSDSLLLTVHTPDYLASLGSSSTVAAIAEVPMLSMVPNWLLQRRILDPMRYATGGTVLGCNLALQYGWAINLSGGYNHAKAASGEGFCFFADIPIGVKSLWADNPDLEVMVVDLDAHQGNGYASVFGGDGRVQVFDMYNGSIYPQDQEAKEHIEFDFPLRPGTGDREYLSMPERELPIAIESAEPDIIIYNAGTDIFKGDPLGGLGVSEEGIIRRDEIVFRNALDRKIPILMLLSGGYTAKSHEIIGKSVINLLERVTAAR